MDILYQPPIDDTNWTTFDADPSFVVLGIVFEANGGLHTVRAALVQTEADN